MKRLALALVFAAQGLVAQAETVKLENVHLCCGACVRGAQAALGKVEGLTAKVDQDSESVTLTADKAEVLKKGIAALQGAGFYGKSDKAEFASADNNGSAEKQARAEFEGIHNCCGGCSKAIVDACKTVDGVAGVGIKAKATTFVVEGNFSSSAVIKALQAAGFQAKVKK